MKNVDITPTACNRHGLFRCFHLSAGIVLVARPQNVAVLRGRPRGLGRRGAGDARTPARLAHAQVPPTPFTRPRWTAAGLQHASPPPPPTHREVEQQPDKGQRIHVQADGLQDLDADDPRQQEEYVEQGEGHVAVDDPVALQQRRARGVGAGLCRRRSRAVGRGCVRSGGGGQQRGCGAPGGCSLTLYLNSTNRTKVMPAMTATKMMAFSRAPPSLRPAESSSCGRPRPAQHVSGGQHSARGRIARHAQSQSTLGLACSV